MSALTRLDWLQVKDTEITIMVLPGRQTEREREREREREVNAPINQRQASVIQCYCWILTRVCSKSPRSKVKRPNSFFSP